MPSQFRMKCRNRVREISNYRKIARSHPIQLGGINFKVNDFGMRGKPRRITRDAVVEPRPKYHQQIGLVQSRVGGTRPVHAHHPEVIRRLRWNGAQSMDGGKCGNIQIVEQPPQLRDRSRQFGARAHQRDWF